MTTPSRFALVSLLAAASSPSAFAQCEVQALAPTPHNNVDVFGWSVDVEGDLLAVGSNGQDNACPTDPNCNSGGAFLFERTPSGWSQITELVPANNAFRDEFGQDVSISGDRVLVGSHTKLGGGGAYVFVRDALGAWSEEQFLLGSTLADGHHFGHSVSLDGDTALVCAMRDPQNGPSAGAGFIFGRGPGGWVEVTKLVASDGVTDDLFGRSCHLDGDTIFIGCHLSDGVGTNSGTVYVFERDDAGTPGDPTDDLWTETQKLTPSDADGGDLFGRSVVVQGDFAIVGSSQNTPAGASAARGSAYVFERVAGTWTEVQILNASDGEMGDAFGLSVTMDGDRVVIGAASEDEGGNNAGAAYVFERSGAGFIEVQKLIGSEPSNNGKFGDETGVSLSGSTLMVSARFSGSALPNGGRVFAYEFYEEQPFDEFCFGDGGVSAGCTPCPCGNDALPGSGGGCLNQAGLSAQLLPSGIPSQACDSLRFEMSGGNPNTFAILSSGAAKAPANAVNPCFGTDSGIVSPPLNGLRCVVQGVLRHGTRPIDSNGDVGVTTNGWGLPNGPPGGLIVQGGFVAGQTRHYQVIYRESPFASCSQDLNSSQGVTVTFLP
ncbi:MAG: hypothetical protein AAF368_01755 [Planctomycetota bacterium]